MGTNGNTDLIVLHGLAVKKAAPAPAVAAVTGVDEVRAEEVLGRAASEGRVAGAKGLFMLTPAGRSWLDEQYPVVFDELRSDSRMTEAYDRFEEVNREILDLFTRWQTVDVGGSSVPNDHTDEDYDNSIIDELGDIHERMEPVLDQLAEVDPRFEIYKQRLEHAYDRVMAGEHDHVSGARIDSYHTVWFELHEDLLRVLGRTREEV
jgi:hypothetical protein